MTKEEMKNKITEHKECCKKLAEEYRQRYNEDKTDKLAIADLEKENAELKEENKKSNVLFADIIEAFLRR